MQYLTRAQSTQQQLFPHVPFAPRVQVSLGSRASREAAPLVVCSFRAVPLSRMLKRAGHPENGPGGAGFP